MRMRWIALTAILAACGTDGTPHDGTDAAVEVDAGIDAPLAPDAATDADAAPDAAPDAAIDAPPAAALVVTPPTYGVVETFVGAARLVHLENTGSADATLEPTVDGDFALTEGTTCIATLAPGQACDLEVTVTATAIGTREGTLVLGDAANTTVLLTATGAGRITVDVSGGGTGHITSDPAGIDCGATCSALFTTPVTLTATPDGDARWTGWTGPTLVVTPQVSPTALPGAWSLLGTLTIAAGGDQPFEVRVVSADSFDIEATCDGPCTLAIEAGSHIEVQATTPAFFGGLSGACTTLADDCELTTTADDTVTVTATGDTHLARAYHLAGRIESGDVLPGGDFVVGASDGVSRIDAATGEVLWTVPDVGLTAVAATPDGHVAALADSTLSYLDAADGSVVWTRAADDPRFPAGTFPQIAVSPVDGDVAVTTGGGTQVTVFTPAGDVAFAVPLAHIDGVVYRSDGTLDVFTVRNPAVSHTPIDVSPFASDGTAQAKVLNVGTHFLSGGRDAIALESGGGVVSSTTSDSTVQLQLGAPVVILDDSSIDDLEVPLVAVAPDDHIWWGRSLFGARGFTLELRTPALGSELSVDSPHDANVFVSEQAQRQVRALPDGGAVVFSEYASDISALHGAILVYER